MVATVLIITVLNCFFMISTTVSTCALWWQNKRYRCRNCGCQHINDEEVHYSDKKRKKKKGKGMNCKLDEDFENYVQCANPYYCYGINEDSPRPNGFNCNKD